MRLTVNVGLICVTLAFCAFMKYFAGPLALQKDEHDYVINLMVFSSGAMFHKAPQKPPSIVFHDPLPPPDLPSEPEIEP